MNDQEPHIDENAFNNAFNEAGNHHTDSASYTQTAKDTRGLGEKIADYVFGGTRAGRQADREAERARKAAERAKKAEERNKRMNEAAEAEAKSSFYSDTVRQDPLKKGASEFKKMGGNAADAGKSLWKGTKEILVGSKGAAGVAVGGIFGVARNTLGYALNAASSVGNFGLKTVKTFPKLTVAGLLIGGYSAASAANARHAKQAELELLTARNDAVAQNNATAAQLADQPQFNNPNTRDDFAAEVAKARAAAAQGKNGSAARA